MHHAQGAMKHPHTLTVHSESVAYRHRLTPNAELGRGKHDLPGWSYQERTDLCTASARYAQPHEYLRNIEAVHKFTERST